MEDLKIVNQETPEEETPKPEEEKPEGEGEPSAE